MADSSQRNREIYLEPFFDRYLGTRLEQAYNIIVPAKSRPTRKSCTLKEEIHEDSRHFFSRVYQGWIAIEGF